MKAQRGRTGIALLFLNFATRWACTYSDIFKHTGLYITGIVISWFTVFLF